MPGLATSLARSYCHAKRDSLHSENNRSYVANSLPHTRQKAALRGSEQNENIPPPNTNTWKAMFPFAVVISTGYRSVPL